jgi:hypothetical protein
MSFAKFNVESQIFFKSAKSYGLVNLKPIVPGHVLVIPRRVVPRMADLQVEELNDLFQSVQRVTIVLVRTTTVVRGTVLTALARGISCRRHHDFHSSTSPPHLNNQKKRRVESVVGWSRRGTICAARTRPRPSPRRSRFSPKRRRLR